MRPARRTAFFAVISAVVAGVVVSAARSESACLSSYSPDRCEDSRPPQEEQPQTQTSDAPNKKTRGTKQEPTTTTMSGANADLPPAASMSASALRDELTRRGVTDFSRLLEKPDYVARLEEARLAQGPALPAAVPKAASNGSPYGPFHVVGDPAKAKGLVTLMHGLGDTANGWLDAAEAIASREPSLLFLLPTAPTRKVTLNMGATMPAWYDIIGLTADSREDNEAIAESAAYIVALAQETARKHRIRPENVVYGGFSQGSVISLFAGLTAEVAPRGVLVLSGYLGGRAALVSQAREANKNVRVLVCHGTSDPLLPLARAKQTVEGLVKMIGVAASGVTFKEYPGLAHSANQQEIDDVRRWLAETPWVA